MSRNVTRRASKGCMAKGPRKAFEQVSATLEAAGPGEITVQSQLAGVEMVLGLRHDPVFGPVLMVGLEYGPAILALLRS